MAIIHLETGTAGTPALGASGQIANLLSGSAFEFTRGPARIDVGLVAAATGVTSRIQFGAIIEVEAMAVPVWVTANRGPIWPDDIQVSSVAHGNSRLVVQLTNTTAGAIVVRCLVKISPILAR